MIYMKISIITFLFFVKSVMPNNIEDIIKEYNAREVFYSITLLKNHSGFKDQFAQLTFDSTLYTYNLPNEKEMKIFMLGIQRDLEKMGSDKSIILLNRIERITHLNMSLNAVNRLCNSEKENPIIQALYIIPTTKKLFTKYIQNPQLQDWNSLSSYESNKLYQDFVNYFIELPDKSQRALLGEIMRVLLKSKLD